MERSQDGGRDGRLIRALRSRLHQIILIGAPAARKRWLGRRLDSGLPGRPASVAGVPRCGRGAVLRPRRVGRAARVPAAAGAAALALKSCSELGRPSGRTREAGADRTTDAARRLGPGEDGVRRGGAILGIAPQQKKKATGGSGGGPSDSGGPGNRGEKYPCKKAEDRGEVCINEGGGVQHN
ncbi:hypothetical protein NDU88_005584 [Pleurodeles waltl]|uniref:Uncharacterized protein n=1 Tax=Pleurodeles waltl TaxID=8319 RepID=A0AAV7SM80_PLEWA|nr:hypothetical protein NDU88_005584 [Pleurodeles waltl]